MADSPDILSISITAFFTVFLILAILALIMKLITGLFPVKKEKNDQTIYAAIASLHSKYFPGTKITKIEEVK